MDSATGAVNVMVDGRSVSVPPGSSAAAAVAISGKAAFRRSVTGEPRGPLCGMGTCFECRATVDGVPGVRTCRVVCREGMQIRTESV
jgi:sarcosine oxidase subunit alpha